MGPILLICFGSRVGGEPVGRRLCRATARTRLEVQQGKPLRRLVICRRIYSVLQSAAGRAADSMKSLF